MDQDILDWILLLVRWLHITVAVTWIGTSIFFMWLDRTFVRNAESTRPGHVGELWMVHGGGFYHVEKLLMGPTKVPEVLHWFKWEAYWTWMSGMMLMVLIFYLGEGTFLLDPTISDITFWPAVGLGLFSLLGSWVFYDFLWEREFTRKTPVMGHFLTLAWFAGMTYFLCHTFSGRAAYMHIGGMIGTWMTANVFMRIIPRQVKMVEASKTGETVNQDWAKNAKNRSTHNTYFTLPVIFIMLSNHFPQTYGHDYNWLILLLICAGGAAIREFFVVRVANPTRSLASAAVGIALIAGVIIFSQSTSNLSGVTEPAVALEDEDHDKAVAIPPSKVAIPAEDSAEASADSPSADASKAAPAADGPKVNVTGEVILEGTPPEMKKLNLPAACAKQIKGPAYSNEVIVNNGKLQNVLVRVVGGLEGQKFTDVPKEEVELDQRGCMYEPRVAAARVGQKVTFINSDPVFHNVRSVTKKNQKFNMAMPHKDQRETKVFNKPEIFLQTTCSVHPWMNAYVAIMDHPFYSVTREKGEFEIADLPAGKYKLEAWHEVFGTQTRDIEVTAEGMSPITFTFTKEKK